MAEGTPRTVHVNIVEVGGGEGLLGTTILVCGYRQDVPNFLSHVDVATRDCDQRQYGLLWGSLFVVLHPGYPGYSQHSG